MSLSEQQKLQDKMLSTGIVHSFYRSIYSKQPWAISSFGNLHLYDDGQVREGVKKVKGAGCLWPNRESAYQFFKQWKMEQAA